MSYFHVITTCYPPVLMTLHFDYRPSATSGMFLGIIPKASWQLQDELVPQPMCLTTMTQAGCKHATQCVRLVNDDTIQAGKIIPVPPQLAWGRKMWWTIRISKNLPQSLVGLTPWGKFLFTQRLYLYCQGQRVGALGIITHQPDQSQRPASGEILLHKRNYTLILVKRPRSVIQLFYIGVQHTPQLGTYNDSNNSVDR